MNKILEIKDIKKQFDTKTTSFTALNGISFVVNKGEFIAIMGPSGSGKSTLLNCIAALDTVSSGNIIINDKDITALKGKQLDNFRANELGFIFQDFNLLDTLTSFENIALSLSIKGEKTYTIKQKVNEISSIMGIEAQLDKFPSQMSGGQKQRVAAARAIVTNPSLILADEPTGSLDSKSAKTLLESLTNLNKEFNSTILMVTHDPFTASYANKILFIKDGLIYKQLEKEDKTNQEFLSVILDTLNQIGEV
ncbi:MAG: ABC transporter ATP-binding protein [Anaeroplasmataceae bacterium]